MCMGVCVRPGVHYMKTLVSEADINGMDKSAYKLLDIYISWYVKIKANFAFLYSFLENNLAYQRCLKLFQNTRELKRRKHQGYLHKSFLVRLL